MPNEVNFKEDSPIDFKFATYGELVRVIGERRARAMIRDLRRKEAGVSKAPSREDLEMALRFLRGEKTGPQASRALRALRVYFAADEKPRKACEAHLRGEIDKSSCVPGSGDGQES